MSQHPDFSIKTGGVAPDSLANLLQRKQQIEADQRKQKQDSRFNSLLQAIQLGENIVDRMTASSERKKKQETIDNLVEQAGQELLPSAQAAGLGGDQPFDVRPTQRQSRQIELTKALVRADPGEFVKQKLKTLGGGPQGAPPRTVSGIFVDQFNRKQIDLPTLKKRLQEFDPDIAVIKDENTGNSFVYDKRTQTLTTLTGQKQAGKKGKVSARQFTPVENRAIGSIRQQISADAVLNADRSSLIKANTTRRLLEQNRPGDVGFIRTQMAKAAGEQRITDADIVRFSGSPALIAKARRALKSALDGNLPDADVADYLALLDVSELAAAERLNEQINSFVATAALETEGANLEALKQRIAPGIVPFIKRLKKISNPTAEQKADAFFDTLLKGQQ